MTTISPRAAHVDIPADPTRALEGNPDAVVTLTLPRHDGGGGGDYRVARPTVTLFPAGNARGCSEPVLFEAYREGKSAEAFRVLVERHRPAVARACYQVLGNWFDAEDVTQMVFLALAQRQVRLQTTLTGWLRAVARNASIAYLRSRNRRSRHECRAARPLQVPPEDSARDLREELDAALAQLSAPLADAVRLRYLEGWSQLEAARILGCPRGTLSQRAALALRGLRGILGRGEDRAEGE